MASTPSAPSARGIYDRIQESAQFVRARAQATTPGFRPTVGIVLGSGLGHIADRVQNRVIIPYKEIPHFHGTSVEGHAGQMILGTLEGVPVVILSGRFHVYEGYPMETVVHPTRTVCALGIHTLLLTNAAGGINTRYRPCDLMVIEDHINLTGDNPLKGPNIAEMGPRFPDMTEAYDRSLVEALTETAAELKIPHHRGVYVGLLGPTYETSAEVRMLRVLGADAVGMSTVPETIAANHLGVRVAGVSCITNLAAGTSPQKLTHAEVVQNSQASAENMRLLIEKSLPKMAVLRKR